MLNVGCGNYPLGSVNIDLFLNATEHRGGTVINKMYSPRGNIQARNKLPKFTSIFLIVFVGLVLVILLLPKHPSQPTTQVELYYDTATGQQYSKDLNNPSEGFVPLDNKGSSPFFPLQRGNR